VQVQVGAEQPAQARAASEERGSKAAGERPGGAEEMPALSLETQQLLSLPPN